MNYRTLHIGLGLSFTMIVMAILIGSFVQYNPRYDDPKDQVDFSLHYARYREADSIAHVIASQDQKNKINQDYWINIHFQIPEVCQYVIQPRYKRSPAKYKSFYRDDLTIIHYFTQQKDAADLVLKKNGTIALASCYLQMNNLDSASVYLAQADINLPGCNANWGLYCMQKNQMDSALYFFNEELALNGHNKIAYRNLAYHYIKEGDQEKLYKLVQDPQALAMLSSSQQRYIHFNRMQVLSYWHMVFKNTFSHWNKFSFVGAFLISFFWIFYLYKIDLYEPEKKRYVFLCFVLGCCSVLLTEFLSDMNHYWFGHYLNGQTGNDFIFSVLGIGLIEEFSKAVPFLIMVYALQQVNEPYDFIKYACISALGFAFVENILYIDSYGIKVMHGRMTLSVFGHIFFSSIIGYTMALNQYRWKMFWWYAFVLGLGLASFAHGFYDFWLINQAVSGLSLLSYVMIILAIFIFHGFINSALNNSDFFDRNKKFDNVYYSTILIVGSSLVYAYEYISSFLLYGFDYGLDNVYRMISYAVCIYAAIFLVVVNRVIIVPKNWLTIFHLFHHPKNRLEGELKEGVSCRFKKFTANFYQEKMFPASGVIEKIVKEGERKYYLVKFMHPVAIDMPVKSHFVFRLKEKMDKGDDLAACYVIPDEALLASKKFANKRMIFCGWMKFEIQDEVAVR